MAVSCIDLRFGEVCLKPASLVTMAAQASVWCIYFVCMVQLFGFALPRAISQDTPQNTSATTAEVACVPAGQFSPEEPRSGCGKLVSPRNGVMKLDISKTQEGSMETAEFSCNTGYYLVGPKTITCKNASWEGHEPTCQPVECGPLEPLENGKVEVSATTYQSKALYSCKDCYRLEGVERRSCKKSGLWSKSLPKCILRVCLPLQPPPKMYVPIASQGNISCGQHAFIRCFNGFRVGGAQSATCLPNGEFSWNGPTPWCIDLGWT